MGRGAVPKRWRSLYPTRQTLTISDWVADLKHRIEAVGTYSSMLTPGITAARDGESDSTIHKTGFWLGGMFSPEAFFTATRQHVAQVTTLSSSI